MKKMSVKKTFVSLFMLLSLGLPTNPSWALSSLVSKSFQTVAEKASEFSKLYGFQHVLLIYDMDRTLVPAKEINVSIVKQMQKAGFPSIILTGREPKMHNGTLIELKKSGYNFSLNPLADLAESLKQNPDLFSEACGACKPSFKLNENEQSIYQKGLKPVSYRDGVFLAAGQNKGLMLLALLHHSPAEIKAVVFIDDDENNCKNVLKALQSRHLDGTVIHYPWK